MSEIETLVGAVTCEIMPPPDDRREYFDRLGAKLNPAGPYARKHRCVFLPYANPHQKEFTGKCKWCGKLIES